MACKDELKSLFNQYVKHQFPSKIFHPRRVSSYYCVQDMSEPLIFCSYSFDRVNLTYSNRDGYYGSGYDKLKIVEVDGRIILNETS